MWQQKGPRDGMAFLSHHFATRKFELGYEATQSIKICRIPYTRILTPVGKREAIGHPLPVVAIGLIPYIYRRASFSHRAAPKEIAPYGEQHYRSLTARQRSLQLSNPRREICFFFKRQLSFLEIRLYFMHLIRLRIHASNFVNWVVTVANTGLK